MKESTIVIIALFSLAWFGGAYAQPGFSIQGGLLHDTPAQDTYERMEAGIGYVGNFGFDLYERLGLEIGVLHSTHDYLFVIEANAIREKDAEKNTIFFKVRAIPYKIGKAEFVLAAGPALFDISGVRRFENRYDLEDGFSGWGAVLSFDMRYFVSQGLALTFYLSGNFVKYDQYTVNSIDFAYPGDLPGGDSVSWGLTVFHRIGMPKL